MRKESRYAYRAIVMSPTGEPMLWTQSDTVRKTKRMLLKGRLSWEYAVRQGYRLKWIKDYVAGR